MKKVLIYLSLILLLFGIGCKVKPDATNTVVVMNPFKKGIGFFVEDKFKKIIKPRNYSTFELKAGTHDLNIRVKKEKRLETVSLKIEPIYDADVKKVHIYNIGHGYVLALIDVMALYKKDSSYDDIKVLDIYYKQKLITIDKYGKIFLPGVSLPIKFNQFGDGAYYLFPISSKIKDNKDAIKKSYLQWLAKNFTK